MPRRRGGRGGASWPSVSAVLPCCWRRRARTRARVAWCPAWPAGIGPHRRRVLRRWSAVPLFRHRDLQVRNLLFESVAPPGGLHRCLAAGSRTREHAAADCHAPRRRREPFRCTEWATTRTSCGSRGRGSTAAPDGLGDRRRWIGLTGTRIRATTRWPWWSTNSSPCARRSGSDVGTGTSAPWESPWVGMERSCWPRNTRRLVGAVAAISPAVWTSYAEAQAVNSGAYASAAAFTANDVVTHVDALEDTPVRVAPGFDDPFHPGVVALSQVLPILCRRVLEGLSHGGLLQRRRAPIAPVPGAAPELTVGTGPAAP